jgi:hypothetical protein
MLPYRSFTGCLKIMTDYRLSDLYGIWKRRACLQKRGKEIGEKIPSVQRVQRTLGADPKFWKSHKLGRE